MIEEELIEELNKKNLDMAHRIRMENNIRASSDEAYSFIITGINFLFPDVTFTDLKDSITDDNPDAEFDVILFSEKDKSINVFDFKHKTGFRYDDIQLFRDNIKSYLFDPRQPLEGLADRPKIKIKQARSLIRKMWKVNIYVVRGSFDSPRTNVRDLMKSLTDNYNVNSINLLNIHDLINVYLLKKSKKNDCSWPIKIVSGSSDPSSADKIIIKGESANSIKSLIARISLSELVKLQSKFLENDLNLFDANVRDFLKNKSLSTGILRSIKNNPSEFYIFHNGLTFSCSKIQPVDQLNYTIVNPQVINGCQTVNTIYEKYKNDPSNPNLRKSTVLCRFYSLEQDTIEKVCEATNTQVKINLWNLRANDDIQKIIQEALLVKDIDYRRKTYSGKDRSVFITDLGQWIYSCISKEPAFAKNNKSKLFDVIPDRQYRRSHYDRIFNKQLSLDEIVKICEIAFYVYEKIGRIRKNERTFENDADLHFIIAFFELKEKNWSDDWKFKRVHKLIEQSVKYMRRTYGNDFSYNKIFTKTDETWEFMRRKLNRW